MSSRSNNIHHMIAYTYFFSHLNSGEISILPAIFCNHFKSLDKSKNAKCLHRSRCIFVEHLYYEPPVVVDTKFHRVMINKMTWSWCPNDFWSTNRLAPKCVQQPSKVALQYKQQPPCDLISMENELYGPECVE